MRCSSRYISTRLYASPILFRQIRSKHSSSRFLSFDSSAIAYAFSASFPFSVIIYPIV
nr:MAG TPA: hypothetical protein [Caudoviricetes sp.]